MFKLPCGNTARAEKVPVVHVYEVHTSLVTYLPDYLHPHSALNSQLLNRSPSVYQYCSWQVLTTSS